MNYRAVLSLCHPVALDPSGEILVVIQIENREGVENIANY